MNVPQYNYVTPKRGDSRNHYLTTSRQDHGHHHPRPDANTTTVHTVRQCFEHGRYPLRISATALEEAVAGVLYSVEYFAPLVGDGVLSGDGMEDSKPSVDASSGGGGGGQTHNNNSDKNNNNNNININESGGGGIGIQSFSRSVAGWVLGSSGAATTTSTTKTETGSKLPQSQAKTFWNYNKNDDDHDNRSNTETVSVKSKKILYRDQYTARFRIPVIYHLPSFQTTLVVSRVHHWTVTGAIAELSPPLRHLRDQVQAEQQQQERSRGWYQNAAMTIDSTTSFSTTQQDHNHRESYSDVGCHFPEYQRYYDVDSRRALRQQMKRLQEEVTRDKKRLAVEKKKEEEEAKEGSTSVHACEANEKGKDKEKEEAANHPCTPPPPPFLQQEHEQQLQQQQQQQEEEGKKKESERQGGTSTQKNKDHHSDPKSQQNKKAVYNRVGGRKKNGRGRNKYKRNSSTAHSTNNSRSHSKNKKENKQHEVLAATSAAASAAVGGPQPDISSSSTSLPAPPPAPLPLAPPLPTTATAAPVPALSSVEPRASQPLHRIPSFHTDTSDVSVSDEEEKEEDGEEKDKQEHEEDAKNFFRKDTARTKQDEMQDQQQDEEKLNTTLYDIGKNEIGLCLSICLEVRQRLQNDGSVLQMLNGFKTVMRGVVGGLHSDERSVFSMPTAPTTNTKLLELVFPLVVVKAEGEGYLEFNETEKELMPTPRGNHDAGPQKTKEAATMTTTATPNEEKDTVRVNDPEQMRDVVRFIEEVFHTCLKENEDEVNMMRGRTMFDKWKGKPDYFSVFSVNMYHVKSFL